MIESCDFCGREALEEVYEPRASASARSIFLCAHCALAQSLPRQEAHAPAQWPASPPLRLSKGFRVRAALARLKPHVSFNAPLEVLDVGAGRGAFVDALLERAPLAALTAIEPDASLVQPYRNRPRVTLAAERAERVRLPAESYDLIHSCHVLQEMPSARSALTDHHRALKQGGILYVEVPSLEMIGTPDLALEWFVDSHNFHYAPNVLVAELKAMGFAILTAPDPRDVQNAAVIARKNGPPALSVRSYPREVEAAQELFARYKARRPRLSVMHNEARP